jgi:hypothetical protein
MRALLPLLLSILLAGPAFAMTIASHVGPNDPVSEGWTFNNGGDSLGTAAPVLGDGLSNLGAWTLDDDGTNSNLSYSQDLSPVATMLVNGGWRYAVRLRVADLSDPIDFGVSAQVELNGRAYVMNFGSDAAGTVTVRLVGTGINGGGGDVATLTNGVDDYHLFEFLESDSSSTTVDFLIDGNLVYTSYFGQNTSRNLVAFGDTSTSPGSGGQGNYAEVTLTSLPEPSTLVLILSGLAIVVSRRVGQ